MKLDCRVIIQNRLLPSLSMKSSTKSKNAVIKIIKPGKDSEVYLMLFTQDNKSGYRYKESIVHNNIEKTFGQFSKEGKCTIRFREPNHDLCISADAIPLKNFMLYLKKVWKGELGVNPTLHNEVDVTLKSRQKSYKLDIRKKEDYPVLKGFSKTLQCLSISDCKLSKFDSRILKLQNLTTLCLSKNNLKTIPEELGNLPLQQLYLDNNNLKTENWRFLSQTTISKTLNILDLSRNEIKSLPPSLSRFILLKSLKVSKNLLAAIPFGICLLPELQELDLSYNHIKALPGTIKRRHLKKLDILDLSANTTLSSCNEMDILNIFNHKKMHNTLFSLLGLSGQRIIDSRLEYNEEVLPSDLVRLLDGAGQCICGKTTMRGYGLLWHSVETKSIANTFVSTNRQTTVPIVFTSCSAKYNAGA